MVTATTVLATEEHVNELPMDPIWMGVGAFGVLIVLLLITLQFNRHR